MRRVLALWIVGATLAMAASPGLASPLGVDGVVTQKFVGGGDNAYIIAVDGAPVEVPLVFYLTVNVGDAVHFDGVNWTVAGR